MTFKWGVFIVFLSAMCVQAQPLVATEWKGKVLLLQPDRYSFTENDGTTIASSWGARATFIWRITQNVDVTTTGNYSKIGKSGTLALGATKKLPWLGLSTRVAGAIDVGSEYSIRIPSATNFRGGIALFRDEKFEVNEELDVRLIGGAQFDGGNWQGYAIENDVWKKQDRHTLSGFVGFLGASVVYTKGRVFAFAIPSFTYPKSSERPLHAFVFGEQPFGLGIKF